LVWLVGSREYTNFTYELTTENIVDSPLRRVMDLEPRYGRRAASYAIVRATRPHFAAAPLQNADEGHRGRLTALDINRDAGALNGGEYAAVIDLCCDDSVTVLAASASAVDLFLHDSDHRYDHQSAEYRAVATSLTQSALVMTDHGALALRDFAKSSGRRFPMFREHPADQGAPGSTRPNHARGDVMVDEETHDRPGSAVPG
jgi:hypothetical protein